MNPLLLLAACCLTFFACKVNDGNQIISNNTNSNPGQGGKVIFRGKNNKVIINNNNVNNQDVNNQDVVIVEGNNNVLEINSSNLHSTAQNSHDTLLLQGNKQRVSLNQSGIDTSQNSRQMITISSVEQAENAVYQKVRYFRPIENGDTLTTEQYEQSKRELAPFIAQKNLYAQFLMGKVQGMQGKPAEAEDLLLKSAKQEYLPAILHIGEVYAYGLYGVSENKPLALDWFRKGAAMGSSYAESMVDWLD